MQLRKGIALAAAALVGTAGGVVFAITGPGASPAEHSATPSTASAPTSTASPSATKGSPSPSEAPFGSGNAEDNVPLLYVADKEIHDGDKVIPIGGIDGLGVQSVDRLARGYLVGTIPGDDQASDNLHIVDSEGRTRHLAKAFSSYDINLAKDRIVAIDYVTELAVVWSDEGEVIAESKEPVGYPAEGAVGFVEDDVAIVSTSSKGSQTSLHWNLSMSKTTKVSSPGVRGMGMSPGGSYLAGSTITGGPNEDPCLGVASDERVQEPREWTACGWRSFGLQAQFSPDNRLVLAVPVLTDGFGPSEFAAFGVREGPKKPAGRFKTPDLTTDAKWADSAHLWLTGARDKDYDFKAGAWIRECDLDGRCETVVTTETPGGIVLGGGIY